MTTTQLPVRTVRVLLADDHAVVRAGLAQLFGTTHDIEVVGAAFDGAHAVSLTLELQPDVVLMDLSMPGVDGTEATRQITESGATARVIALTSFSDRDRIMETFDAGAVGYLLKDAAPEDIIKAVRQAADGQSPVDPKVAQVLPTYHFGQLAWGVMAPAQDVASFGNPPSGTTVGHLAVILSWFVGCGILTVLGYRRELDRERQ